jgi:hypothetical protein
MLYSIVLSTTLHSDTQIALLRVFQDVASAWKQCLRVKNTIAAPKYHASSKIQNAERRMQ